MNSYPIVLNDTQNKELQTIAKLLAGHFEIEKIICFGAFCSQLTGSTCFISAEQHLTNRYYLLVLTKEPKRIEYVIQDFINKTYPDVYILSHGQSSVMEAVYRHDRFFVNACLYGELVYTTDGFSMLPEIDSVEIENSYEKDAAAFARMYSMASGFMECAYECYEKEFYNNIIFLLHQAIEQACRALIRLFTGYRADIHNLDRLLFLCECFTAEPARLFRRHFKEEKRLFRLLAGSYTDARYKDNYQVIDHDADQLCTLVKAFLDLTLELSLKVPHKVTARTTVEEQTAVVDYSPALPASL